MEIGNVAAVYENTTRHNLSQEYTNAMAELGTLTEQKGERIK